jgi:hypothetical protein
MAVVIQAFSEWSQITGTLLLPKERGFSDLPNDRSNNKYITKKKKKKSL